MTPAFRIVSGAHAGQTFTPPALSFLAGRHADAALRFSVTDDLAVSALHAEFTCRSGTWYVRDLGSRNGTLLNGTPLAGPAALTPGDHIGFGADGPVVVFEDAGGAAAALAEDVQAVITREKLRLRLVAAALLSAVVLFAAALVLADGAERAAWDEDRTGLQGRIDSLIASGRTAEASLETEVGGLRGALRESDVELQQLRREASSATRSDADPLELERRVLAASSALQRQQHAATLDFDRIQRRNRNAVAMVWVEYADGGIATGTAFAVRADGTMLTNRHIVHGRGGGQVPRRIAIRFSDSEQTFPGSLVGVSDTWDLAAVRVENVLGDVPVITRLNSRADTLPAETPLAMIGFPLGGEPMALTRASEVARPLVSAGLLRTATPRMLELQGIGADGGSGSPIIDPMGDVVGMLYGGRNEAGTQILLAVPAHALIVFLSSLR